MHKLEQNAGVTLHAATNIADDHQWTRGGTPLAHHQTNRQATHAPTLVHGTPEIQASAAPCRALPPLEALLDLPAHPLNQHPALRKLFL